MRGLKLFTTTVFVFGAALLFCWPWVLGARPDKLQKSELAQWTVQAMVLFLLAVASFMSAAVGAYLIVKKTRQSYSSELKENLKELIEGSLHDHDKS